MPFGMLSGVVNRAGNHVLDGDTHWRHLANTVEPSVCGGDAALCRITLTTCFTKAPASFQNDTAISDMGERSPLARGPWDSGPVEMTAKPNRSKSYFTSILNYDDLYSLEWTIMWCILTTTSIRNAGLEMILTKFAWSLKEVPVRRISHQKSTDWFTAKWPLFS